MPNIDMRWTEWKPLSLYDVKDHLAERFGHDDEDIRSILHHLSDCTVTRMHFNELVKEALALNDEGRINLPSRWIESAMKEIW